MKPMRLNISTMEYRVWVALRAFGIHGATGRQVAESLSHDIDSTTVTVYHLREKGRAQRVARGIYRAIDLDVGADSAKDG